MIKADARQKEYKMFDDSCKLKHLAFEDMSYEQSIKVRKELEILRKKQQFYKCLIQLSDYLNKEEIANEQYFTR